MLNQLCSSQLQSAPKCTNIVQSYFSRCYILICKLWFSIIGVCFYFNNLKLDRNLNTSIRNAPSTFIANSGTFSISINLSISEEKKKILAHQLRTSSNYWLAFFDDSAVFRMLWVEISSFGAANTTCPIYLVTFSGITSFYVIDFFSFRPYSLSVVHCTHVLFNVFILSSFFLPLWHHCQNWMIYNYLKSFDFLLQSLCFKHTFVDVVVVFVRNWLCFPCYSQRHLCQFLHSHHVHFIYTCASCSYIGNIMLSHLLLTLCSTIQIYLW